MKSKRRIALALAVLALGAGGTAETQERPVPARGWLGISYSVTEQERGSERSTRVVIEDVHPGSPAERAGVRPGDEVVRWNGRADVGAVMGNVRALQPGDTVRLRVRRGSERDRELTVIAGDRPRHLAQIRPRSDAEDAIVISPKRMERELRIQADSLVRRADSLHVRLRRMLQDSLGPHLRMLEREIERMGPPEEAARRLRDNVLWMDVGRRSVAGAEFSEMNEGLAAYFGTDRGVLVLQVAPGTPAARAGLQPGDIVLRADGAAVEDVADLRRALFRAQKRAARELELELRRKGAPRRLKLRWD